MKRMILAATLCCAALPAAAQEAGSSTRVYDLAEVERQPVPTNLDALRAALDATYPADKRAAGQGARVSVAFVLSPEGVPRELTVMQSTDAAFDSVTIATLTLLRFQPATVGGRPVAVRVEVPVEWRVDTQAPEPPSAAVPADEPEVSADGVRIYELSEVDQVPRPTNLNALRRELERHYPGSLRNAGIEGTVQVRFVVTEAGAVDDVLVTRTTDLRFNVATIQAIGVLRFTPGRVDGRAVRTAVELPIQWNVEKPARPQNDGRSPAWRAPAEP